MNGELEKIKKIMWPETQSQHTLGRTEKKHEKTSARKWNQVSTK
jgi:hypothetical protein